MICTSPVSVVHVDELGEEPLAVDVDGPAGELARDRREPVLHLVVPPVLPEPEAGRDHDDDREDLHGRIVTDGRDGRASGGGPAPREQIRDAQARERVAEELPARSRRRPRRGSPRRRPRRRVTVTT